MEIESVDTENTINRSSDLANVRPKVNLTATEDQAFRAQARDAGLSYSAYLATLVRRGSSSPETPAQARDSVSLAVVTSEFRAAFAEFTRTFGKMHVEKHAIGSVSSEGQARKTVRSEVTVAHNGSELFEWELVWPAIVGAAIFGLCIGALLHAVIFK